MGDIQIESIQKVTIDPDDVVIVKVKDFDPERFGNFIPQLKERLGTDRILVVSGLDIEVWKP